MKTSNRIRHNGANKSARSQAPNKPVSQPANPAAPILSPKWEYPRKSLEGFVRGFFDDPGAKPVFSEWFSSIPRDVLEHLVSGLMTIVPGRAAEARLVDALQLLISGNDLTEDGLWALPEGRLFLWTGELKVAPREVSFLDARAWWMKFQKHAPYLAAPFFEEDTDAERLVSIVCKAMREQPATQRAAA